MSGKEALFELLKQQQQATRGVDWAKNREEWNHAVEDLINNIDAWLEPVKELRVEKISVNLNEEYLGSYSIIGRIIKAPNGIQVTIKPIARNIIGGLGRVDLESLPRKAMLILREKGKWVFPGRAMAGISETPLTEDAFLGKLCELLA